MDTMMFLSELSLRNGTWQALERAVCRLLICEGFANVRIVGQTGDHGADIIGSKYGKRWLFQVKHWKIKVGVSIVDETMGAMYNYDAQVPVIVSLNGFTDEVREHQTTLQSRGIMLQLWDYRELKERGDRLSKENNALMEPFPYQEEAIKSTVSACLNGENRALIVMATGLGKTFVAAESMRRIIVNKPNSKVLVLAHTNPLVYQLERAFWPFLSPSQETVVWNGLEKPMNLCNSKLVFACIDTVSESIKQGSELPEYDVLIVDECHHAGSKTYREVLDHLGAGKPNGPFLIGMTATPWRPDEFDIKDLFGAPRVQIDLVEGMKKGYLSNVDYRIHTDNINWDFLKEMGGGRLSPRQINRTLFIEEWDDAVVTELKEAWGEQKNPRAIVFCGTIDHAITMRNKINSLRFCNAAAIYSQSNVGLPMSNFDRNLILSDFADGKINIVCTVDIFNEGIDVPDVNIIVFQRVTHSRRIFIQQLGRGLRISQGKDKVIVLDFVSDIRRFAAGLSLKDQLSPVRAPSPVRVSINNKVTFRRAKSEDPLAESFLREWLEDVLEIEDAGDDSSELKYPPPIPEGYNER